MILMTSNSFPPVIMESPLSLILLTLTFYTHPRKYFGRKCHSNLYQRMTKKKKSSNIAVVDDSIRGFRDGS